MEGFVSLGEYWFKAVSLGEVTQFNPSLRKLAGHLKQKGLNIQRDFFRRYMDALQIWRNCPGVTIHRCSKGVLKPELLFF